MISLCIFLEVYPVSDTSRVEKIFFLGAGYMDNFSPAFQHDT